MNEDITIRRVMPGDDLTKIQEQTKPDLWAEDNEMEQYQIPALEKFLKNETNWLVIAWQGDQIAGMALCYEHRSPTEDGSTLYVDELDTHPDFRRQGIATELMRWLMDNAKQSGFPEVWLTTESDNVAANAFYQSLKPTERESTVLYSYTTDKGGSKSSGRHLLS